jgi:hypothetical protein
MPVTRSQLSAGPGYATFNSKTVQFNADVDIRTDLVSDVVETSLYGAVDEVYHDMLVKLTGTPTYYDTAAITTMFPYLTGLIGQTYPGASDVPLTFLSDNGDQIILTSAMIGKMPDLELGASGPILGSMEIWGVIGNGMSPATANSYYTQSTGNGYSAPAVPSTASFARQEFTAAWGSVAGFTSFQAQDKWTISHDLALDPVIIQGRTRAFKLKSYRVMAKCMPLGPTMVQIDAATGLLQSAGGGILSGARLSQVNAASNLVISGATSMTVTLGNAALKTAGYMFGGKPLRAGELGWVSTLNSANTSFSGGSFTPALALA